MIGYCDFEAHDIYIHEIIIQPKYFTSKNFLKRKIQELMVDLIQGCQEIGFSIDHFELNLNVFG